MKPDINSGEVHPQLGHIRHPVDGALVGAGSLWPVPLGLTPGNGPSSGRLCQTRQPTVYHFPGRIRHPGPVVVQARPVVDTNLPALVFGSGAANSRVGAPSIGEVVGTGSLGARTHPLHFTLT